MFLMIFEKFIKKLKTLGPQQRPFFFGGGGSGVC